MRKNGTLEDEIHIISLKKKTDSSALWGDDKLADNFSKVEIESLANTRQLQTPADAYEGYPLMLQLLRDEEKKHLVVPLHSIPLIASKALTFLDYYKGALSEASVTFTVVSLRVGSQDHRQNVQVEANHTSVGWSSGPIYNLPGDRVVDNEEERLVIHIKWCTNRHKIR